MRTHSPSLDLRFSSPNDFRIKACNRTVLGGQSERSAKWRTSADLRDSQCGSASSGTLDVPFMLSAQPFVTPKPTGLIAHHPIEAWTFPAAFRSVIKASKVAMARPGTMTSRAGSGCPEALPAPSWGS
jgi:hypothetical protein